MRKFIYCHFAYRRVKGTTKGIFSIALYADKEAKRLVAVRTRALELWGDNQYITGIQAYEHALYSLWELQSKLLEYGVTNVILVTNNGVLNSWIEDIYRNKTYTPYFKRATDPYKQGAVKEINLAVGLSDGTIKENAKKYCKADIISDKHTDRNSNTTSKLDLNSYRTIDDIMCYQNIGENSLTDITEM